jgi:hypothetical protein
LRQVCRDAAVEGCQREFPPELLEAIRKAPEPGPGMMWTVARRKKGLSDEFVAALDACTDSDMSPLADYLLSDKPLSKEERRVIARKLPKRTSGRPKDHQLRAAASVACMFYNAWRSRNKKLAASDHGHCDEMKGLAAQWMVEDWFSWGSGSVELTDDNRQDFVVSVRELMEKPKHLREGDKGLITFPMFGWESKASKTGW